jgi:NTE family protein
LQLALALSGGGIRAAVFHLGVLRRLAEENLLEDVCQLSTVSGGSLAIAVLLAKAQMTWPTSEQFQAELYPILRRVMTRVDLFSFKALGWSGLAAFNLDIIRHRARILAALLERQWDVAGTLRELPDRPAWFINSTCVETGKNWRFAKREMGDWLFGRHYEPSVTIAEAAAASAAVPYVIGALKLSLPSEGWYRTDPATRRPLEKCRPSATLVRLWDGGAYENLALEAVFKPGQSLKGCDYLICSDASGPLPAFGQSNPLGIMRGHLGAPRLFDICSDQIRSLRTRMFMSAIAAGTIKGALVRMGNSVRDIDIKAGRQRRQEDYDRFQADQHVALAFRHPTHLKALSEDVFDGIARHGYEVTDATLTAYSPQEFPKAFHVGALH